MAEARAGEALEEITALKHLNAALSSDVEALELEKKRELAHVRAELTSKEKKLALLRDAIIKLKEEFIKAQENQAAALAQASAARSRISDNNHNNNNNKNEGSDDTQHAIARKKKKKTNQELVHQDGKEDENKDDDEHGTTHSLSCHACAQFKATCDQQVETIARLREKLKAARPKETPLKKDLSHENPHSATIDQLKHAIGSLRDELARTKAKLGSFEAEKEASRRQDKTNIMAAKESTKRTSAGTGNNMNEEESYRQRIHVLEAQNAALRQATTATSIHSSRQHAENEQEHGNNRESHDNVRTNHRCTEFHSHSHSQMIFMIITSS